MKIRNSRKLGLENLESRNLLAVTPVISEFMAVNDSTLADENGDFSDWLEIHNSTDSPVDLGGWHLTDDSGDTNKWTFPSVTIAADEFLLVFASDKDRRDPASELHTNFKLSGGGEYLSLNQPDGTPAEFAYAPEYVPQSADISYGLTLDESQSVYYAQPTPGAANTGDAIGYTGPVEFSVPHGYYSSTFSLHLSNERSDEVIRYTTNGSRPTETTGTVYTEPITVDGTSTVRAAAFKAGFQTEKVETATYIFVNDTVTLTDQDALAAGFPSSLGQGRARYGLSTSVINQHSDSIHDDLVAIPTMSVVTDFEHLFNSRTGIMANPQGRGVTWERPTSVEIIHPDGLESGIQVDAGIRVQGGISRQISDKQSLRLLFKEQYGATKLEYSLYGDNKSSSFDSLVLRGGMGEQFVGLHYIRDRYSRMLQEATGNNASTGKFMHLYVNGVYWGMYDVVERPDELHQATYHGGDKDDWDVLNAGNLGSEKVTAIAGTLDAWNHLQTLTGAVRDASTPSEKSAAYYRVQGLNADGTDNPDFEDYLDVDNYIDYLIVNLFTQNGDWPHRNYYMARQQGGDSEGFRFLAWDNEFSLDQGRSRNITRLENVGPGTVFRSLDSSEDFRVRFSDRVQHLIDPGGVLHTTTADPDSEAVDIYTELANAAASPLVPESARWSSPGFGGSFTVNRTFLPKVNEITSFLRSRTNRFIAEISSANFYRRAPEFSHESGTLDAGTEVSLSSTAGSIYYTLDGTDPRLPGGEFSPSARLYTGPLAVTDRIHLTTRSLTGSSWSAISSRQYLAGAEIASSSNLRISEINYHPHDALTQFGEMDAAATAFEFVELVNTSTLPIDLTGVQIQDGVERDTTFEFAAQLLAPGARVVIPGNRAAFASRYGTSIELAEGTQLDQDEWRLARSLSNGGQLLTVQTLNGSLVQQFRYEDSGDWPGRADGEASSLEIVDANGDYADPDNWRSSSEFGGSPGIEGTGPDNRVVINEVLANSTTRALDAIELYNTTGNAIDIHNWYLSDKSSNYLQYQIPATEVIDGDSYLVLDQNAFGFGLNSVKGDDVYLIQANASGAPVRFVDRVSFGASIARTTLGRWENGEGRLFPMTTSTLGAANSGPELGKVMITEFNFHPDQTPERTWEFVELTNVSSTTANLYGYRLRGDIDYDFTRSLILQPNESILVLGFDPDSMTNWSQSFRDAYSDAATAVLVGQFGNAAELLDNDNGRITLARSGPQVDGETPTYLVDEVNYDSSWGASGNGSSLERVSSGAYGDSPSSWLAGAPTPGLFVDGITSPDFNSDGLLNCGDIDALTAAVIASSDDLTFDLIGDGDLNMDDVTEWLRRAGKVNLATGDSYPMGDADLNGVVNRIDFLIWSGFRFSNTVTWCTGDFNADGIADVTDFNVWNTNRSPDANLRIAKSISKANAPTDDAIGITENPPLDRQHAVHGKSPRTARHSIVEQVFGTWESDDEDDSKKSQPTLKMDRWSARRWKKPSR